MRWLARLLGLPRDWTRHHLRYRVDQRLHRARRGARIARPGDSRTRHGRTQRPAAAARLHHRSDALAHREGRDRARRRAARTSCAFRCDDAFRMRPTRCARASTTISRTGMRPMCVVATVGTTSTTSSDPVAAIAEVTRKHDVWLHVDAAYAGPAAILPEFRSLLDGVEHADSLVVNPHKWLFVPIDLSVLFVRDPDCAAHVQPRARLSDDARNRRPQLHGLRPAARAPLSRAQALVRAAHLRRAKAFGSSCAGTSRSRKSSPAGSTPNRIGRCSAPHPLSVVCFRYAPPGHDDAATDALNAAIMDAVNADGRSFHLAHQDRRNVCDPTRDRQFAYGAQRRRGRGSPASTLWEILRREAAIAQTRAFPER